MTNTLPNMNKIYTVQNMTTYDKNVTNTVKIVSTFGKVLRDINILIVCININIHIYLVMYIYIYTLAY